MLDGAFAPSSCRHPAKNWSWINLPHHATHDVDHAQTTTNASAQPESNLHGADGVVLDVSLRHDSMSIEIGVIFDFRL
jgi:hypothetical protein